ncbi:hypothetical protein QTP88_024861 [Uroleucon formosanum]
MFGRLETEQIFPHCEYVGPCREESEHNKRELMEFAAAENAHGHYKESKAARRDDSVESRCRIHKLGKGYGVLVECQLDI